MSDSRRMLCTFESRRSSEMQTLIERLGGTAVTAPSMREVPLEENSAAISAIEKIVDGTVTRIVLLTGVGTEAMLQIAASVQLEDRLQDAMKNVPLLIRGPKPAAVLNRLGLKYTVKAPEPNTSEDLLAAIDDAGVDLKNQTVAVQEYGISNPDLNAGLEQRGATVITVPVYRWALPDNLEPLQNAIRRTISGDFDALLFTSAQQVRHVLLVADEMQLRGDWLTATEKTLIASIGPTCSEALRSEGLTVGVEASPPKMGPLVRSVMAAME